jgi:UDP-2,3-diacylglucosamine pyrophosphatase LpxH
MILNFIDIHDIVAVGDIHGAFETIVYKANMHYSLKNTIIIVCGDCGFGFHKENYYKTIISKIDKKLKKNNNHLIFFRGNHDNPAYFKDNWSFSNIKLVSDYSIIDTIDKTCLLIGGAISVDRYDRKQVIDVDYNYWYDEFFVLDIEKLTKILLEHKITHVFTHSNPNFCYPFTTEGLNYWIRNDQALIVDVEQERRLHTQLYDILIANKQPIRGWYNGHYHFSKHEFINGVIFKTLDIEEFCEVV